MFQIKIFFVWVLTTQAVAEPQNQVITLRWEEQVEKA